MNKIDALKAELAEVRRQRDVWEGHFRDLNATAGQWRKEAEALQEENDKLREFIQRDKRSHLANARADAAEKALKAGMGQEGA
jgi:flagellar biosynthesis/type III secretory pathway protein FliH